METQTTENLLLQIEELQNRLAEADQMIEAIKAGEVDAFALPNSNNKPEVFTLQSGDYAYRVLVENFSEGALNLSEDGLIVYTNKSFHETLQLSYEKVIGQNISQFIHPDSKETFNQLFKKGLAGQSKGEINLMVGNKSCPVYVSLTSLYPNLPTVGVIISDLTEKKEAIKELAVKKSLQNIFTNVPGATAVYEGPEHKYMLANTAYEKLTNRKAANLLGKRFRDVFPELKGTGTFELYDQVFKTGEPFVASEYAALVDIKNDGVLTQGYFNFSMEPLKNDSGEVYAVLTMTYDITEQVEARQKIEKDAEKLRFNDTIFKTIPDAIISSDVNGKVITWNESAEELYGFSSEEMIGQIMPDMIHTEFISKEQLNWKEIFAQKGHWKGEVMHTCKDGEKIYVSAAASVIKNSQDEITGYVAVNRDITLQKQAENKIKESETLFKLSLALTGQTVFKQDTQLRYTWIYNPHVDFVLTEMIGKIDSDLLDSHSAEMLTKIKQSVLNTGKSFDGEIQIDIKGKTHDFSIRVESSKDITGEIDGIIAVSDDITERREVENKIKESQKELRKTKDQLEFSVKAGGIGLWHWDLKNDVLYWSNEQKEIYGVSISETITSSTQFNTLIVPEDLKRIQDDQSAGDKLEHEYDFRINRKNDGALRWIKSRARNILDEQGALQFISGVNIDITEQVFALNKIAESEKQLEQKIIERTNQLNEKNIALQNMNKELEAFTYISSHDLQEPLRKIQTLAGLIAEKEKQNLSDTGKDYFNRMQDAATRMRMLIQDLLSFSRVSTSERFFETIDLNKIIDEVKSEFKDALAEKQATIEVEEICEVKIIPFQFRQLMQNLISNALKFSKPNVPPHIIIKSAIEMGSELNNRLSDTGGQKELLPKMKYCHISITDNGIGFEKHYSKKIFEVFQRLHGKEEYAGTGIGLSIVKKIVDNHKGIITASSELGKGAQFDIYIPV